METHKDRSTAVPAVHVPVAQVDHQRDHAVEERENPNAHEELHRRGEVSHEEGVHESCGTSITGGDVEGVAGQPTAGEKAGGTRRSAPRWPPSLSKQLAGTHKNA